MGIRLKETSPARFSLKNTKHPVGVSSLNRSVKPKRSIQPYYSDRLTKLLTAIFMPLQYPAWMAILPQKTPPSGSKFYFDAQFYVHGAMGLPEVKIRVQKGWP